MAEIDARLTREIHEAGLAGGIVFSWLDEWFKHTWVTIDLEQPAERTRLWHNVMDAEQNYGLLGEYAGNSATPEPGGDPSRWRATLPLLERHGGPVALRVGADPSYLYLALEGRLTPTCATSWASTPTDTNAERQRCRVCRSRAMSGLSSRSCCATPPRPNSWWRRGTTHTSDRAPATVRRRSMRFTTNPRRWRWGGLGGAGIHSSSPPTGGASAATGTPIRPEEQ